MMNKEEFKKCKVGDRVLIISNNTKRTGQIATIVEIDTTKWGNRMTITNDVIGTRRYHRSSLFYIEGDNKNEK